MAVHVLATTTTLERAGERTLVSCEHIASEKDDRSSLLLLLEIGNKKKKYEIVLIVHSVLTVLFIFLKFCNIFENGQARHDFGTCRGLQLLA